MSFSINHFGSKGQCSSYINQCLDNEYHDTPNRQSMVIGPSVLSASLRCSPDLGYTLVQGGRSEFQDSTVKLSAKALFARRFENH